MRRRRRPFTEATSLAPWPRPFSNPLGPMRLRRRTFSQLPVCMSFLKSLVKTCYGGSAALEDNHLIASCGSRDWKKAHWIHIQVCRNHRALNGCQRIWCLRRAVNSKDVPMVMWLRELYQDTHEYHMSVFTLVKRDFDRWGYVMSASVREWALRELVKAIPCGEYQKMCAYINTW